MNAPPHKTDPYTCGLPVPPRLRDQLGGKATGLAALHEAGFRIPATFLITARAFEGALHSALPSVDTLDGLREALRTRPLHDALARELDEHVARLDVSRWAIRSSAQEEDHARHSFAGQQATRLNVPSNALHDGLREVWASLFAEEPLLYRAHLDLDVVPAPMGVVVQEMVDAHAAGVLFTTSPAPAHHGELVISASRGLGTTVVDGHATDTFFIEKRAGFVRQRELTDPDAPALTDAQLAALTALAEEVEAIFGAPQDVEWAFTDETDTSLVLLQVRPTTHDQARRAPEVWSNVNVGEALPGVGTPMTWSIIRRFSRQGFEQAFGSLGLSVPEEYELVGSFRGRVYLNLTQFMTVASGVPLLAPDTMFSVAGGGGSELVQETYTPRSAREFLIHLPLTIPRILTAQLSMPWLAPAWVRYFERRCADFFAQDLTRLHPSQLRDELDRLDTLFDRNGLIMLTCSANFLMSYIVMREVLQLWCGEDAREHENALLRGLQVRSAEPGLALLELGRLARRSLLLRQLITDTPPDEAFHALHAERQHPDVAQFLEELSGFRARYGHRAPREAELATPRWREDTTFIFEVLRGFITSPHLPSTRDVEREQRTAREGVGGTIRALFPAPLGEAFRALVTFTRGNARRRETLRALVVDSLDMYRHYALECGRRLTNTGTLSAPDEIFFLRHDEVRRWLQDANAARDFRLRVIVRRAVFESLERLPDPPGTFLLEGKEMIPERVARERKTEPPESTLPVHQVIYGLAGSAGRSTGRARVIDTPQRDAHLEPGEILVAPYADVGWTPLFLTASAVVMSLGGPLSHACIVAREYGIPTVVNARGVLDVIQTGDWITVDGDQGVVLLHARPPGQP